MDEKQRSAEPATERFKSMSRQRSISGAVRRSQLVLAAGPRKRVVRSRPRPRTPSLRRELGSHGPGGPVAVDSHLGDTASVDNAWTADRLASLLDLADANPYMPRAYRPRR